VPNVPDGQKEAPRGVSTASGGKAKQELTDPKQVSFPAGVKGTCGIRGMRGMRPIRGMWPLWLGTLWLRDLRRGAP
jgi:hypothetical protein